MNQNLLNLLGFSKEVELVNKACCPFCGESILNEGFRDELSLKEYRISGLCQSCQDEVFKEPIDE